MTPKAIRRAIRRLGARKSSSVGTCNPRALAVRALRLEDATLMAVVAECERDLNASGGDVHTHLVETGLVVTYNHVRAVRMALGFKGRGKAAVGGRLAMDTMSRCASSVEILGRPPGRLAAQLDQLPESERRKVLAGWAR